MSKCKQCAGDIQWIKVGGRWRCFNAGTTTDHWDTCAKRKWERTVREGTPFKDYKGEGYIIDGKKKYVRISSGVVTPEEHKQRSAGA